MSGDAHVRFRERLGVRFPRATRPVLHCRSHRQAQFVLQRIDERFRQCGLELHPTKTRIVYCKDINRSQDYPVIEFTFLGYTFRPRKAVDKYGRVYVNFSPAVSRTACKAMRQTIRGWHLQLKSDKELPDLSVMFDPILKGWQQYYGRFHGSAMSTIWKHVNAYLARWLMRNDDDAQDAVQEASLRAYRFFDGYRGGDPKSWLLAIVRNTCMTWRRRTQRGLSTVVFDETVHGAAHESSAEELLVDAGRRSALRDCIEGLPVDYREVLILREFEEMSYKQIAETAGLPIGTVMSRLARARQRLEECVSGRRRAAGV